jgi:hypothetical protein
MGAVINQARHSFRVSLSDTINIPSPNNIFRSGFISGFGPNIMIRTGANGLFITNNVQPNDIVYNTSLATAALVTSVASETTLNLSADIFTATNQGFIVFRAPQNGGIIEFPTLYISSAITTLRVLTAGGEDVTFNNPPFGPFPMKVSRVFLTGTTATPRILALT